ncbi:hypothetical protein [Silvibacterium acidisoli]|uniref:hypothetical protein n=1 Tax=Acidobacteriaceae bacterium ZG23-2 TaxID=2883246 RepID=UPI00406D321D
MSTTPLTTWSAMPPVTRRVRAYFAPVDRTNRKVSVFDPSLSGQFALDTPPLPWIDLGWIEDFARKSLSKTTGLTTGSPALTHYQVRESIDASVSFRFKTWTKLSMALAGGTQHMNLLEPASGAAANGSGAKAAAAVPLAASGSTASFLAMASGASAGFTAGSIVAVDNDYAAQSGYIGSGVSAGYVSATATNTLDADAIRRVTFNVARVSGVLPTGLQLAQPLIAGVPASTLKVQAVLGFVDREGGSFFQEWSALFVMPGEQGDRLCFYYPRLEALAGAAESTANMAGPLDRIALAAGFRALPATDANDGQQVVCYRTYLPSAQTLV